MAIYQEVKLYDFMKWMRESDSYKNSFSLDGARAA